MKLVTLFYLSDVAPRVPQGRVMMNEDQIGALLLSLWSADKHNLFEVEITDLESEQMLLDLVVSENELVGEEE